MFYPSEKLKLLKEAYLHAQISQGLCKLSDEDEGQVKIEPLAEEVQLQILKNVGFEDLWLMNYVCPPSLLP